MTDASQPPFPFSDLDLSRRLETTEARGNADFVEARARAFPASGARWIEVAGAHVCFDGAVSPITQTFGLGLMRAPTAAELDEIEEFFRVRGADVFHEVSPLAATSLFVMLGERGYQPFEFTSVLYRPLSPDIRLSTNSGGKEIHVRLMRDGEQEKWAQTAARGWGEYEELKDFMLDLSRVSAQRAHAHSFLAERDGEPIATGALSLHAGVALLAGASTIPEGRKRGAQLALLETRLRYAAGEGCDLAMMCAQPGSASQRNAERHGFRIAYTRIKWRLAQRSA